VGEDRDWLEELERRIDWKLKKKEIEEELANLEKAAIYLDREELEERRRILEEELFWVNQKIKEKTR